MAKDQPDGDSNGSPELDEFVTIPNLIGRSEFVESKTAGETIGPYRLIQKLGEGGMGAVWMAEQSHPVKRRVALKLIKSGFGSKEVIARFEAERQALSMMSHPNIARILDAGATDDGQPYFVMELVSGTPVTTYCDQHKLSIDERLKLFTNVCAGVQHAHQKGIIHRDLKPGNIVVGIQDGQAVPKIIDFGLAKAMENTQKLTDQSLFTGIGQILGTLKYMSPEQASLDSIDIDTRTDIYALGVILYELLTGSTPLDDPSIKGQAALKILEFIRDKEPVKPSSKLSSSTNEQVSDITGQRKTDSFRLNRILAGDLDWVVMKALEKDRTRRYESASGMADDVRRYLNNEPIVARPPSLNYRIRKFVRKNRTGVLAAGLMATALIAGIIGTSWGFVRALNAESLASQRFEEAESARQKEFQQRQEAEQNLAYAKKGNGILGSVFANLHPKTEYATVAEFRNALRDNLGAAIEDLEGAAIGDPLTVAELQTTLATSLLAMGQTDEAIVLLKRVRATRLVELGPEHPDTLSSSNNLAMGYADNGQFDKALPLLEQSLERMKSVVGPAHPDTLASMNNLAGFYSETGQLDKALPLSEQTLELTKSALGPDHRHTLLSMNRLAVSYQTAGQLDKALLLYEQTLKLTKSKFGSDHANTLAIMADLGVGYSATGQFDKAQPLLEETLELSKSKFGSDSTRTLTISNNLAEVYRAAGQLEKALPLIEQNLELMKSRLGPDHFKTLVSRDSLAVGYLDAGQLEKALPLFEQNLELSKSKLGPDHPQTLNSMNNLASGYFSVGQLDKALPLLEQTLELRKSKLGVNHPDTLNSMNGLGSVYLSVGQLDKAVPLFEQTLKLMKSKLGPDHPDVLRNMANLAMGYEVTGQLDKSLPLFEQTLELRTTKLGPDHPDTLNSMNSLAHCYYQAGQLDKALPLYEQTLELMKSKLGPDHPDTLLVMANLAKGYQAAGQLEKALPFFEIAAVGMERQQFRLQFAPSIITNTIAAYQSAQQFVEADRWQHKWLAFLKSESGPESTEVANALAVFGFSLLERKAWEASEPVIRECLLIRQKTQSDVWNTFSMQSMLGASLLGQQKYADAEPLLIAGYDGMKAREDSIPPAAAARMSEALDRLIELYTAIDNAELLKKWQAEKEKLAEPVEE